VYLSTIASVAAVITFLTKAYLQELETFLLCFMSIDVMTGLLVKKLSPLTIIKLYEYVRKRRLVLKMDLREIGWGIREGIHLAQVGDQ
jgi:hypothetical protein